MRECVWMRVEVRWRVEAIDRAYNNNGTRMRLVLADK
jgi:hypothetical protein